MRSHMMFRPRAYQHPLFNCQPNEDIIKIDI